MGDWLITELRFLGITVLAGGCYGYLAQKFMQRARAGRTVGIAYITAAILLYYLLPVFNNFTAYCLLAMAGFLVMYGLERENAAQKLFLSVTFFSLRWLVMAMEQCAAQPVYHWQYTVSAAQPEMQAAAWMAVTILEIGFCSALMFFASWLIQRAYRYKREAMAWREFLLLFIPSLSSVLGYAMLQSYHTIYERATGANIMDAEGAYSGLCFFYYLASLMAIVTVIVIFQHIKSLQKEEYQNLLLMDQLTSMERHITEVDQLYRQIRSLRHDMGSHAMVLEGLCERREYQTARDYLTHLRGELEKGALEIKSGSPVTDVILAERKREAEKRGIAFSSQFHYPEGTPVNAFDLSVILDNAILNALDAAAGCDAPFLRVRSYRRRNAYLMEFVNSFQGELRLNESGLPETNRHDQERHGFGLTNIQRTAQKYHGDMDIQINDGIFTLRVMLMVE